MPGINVTTAVRTGPVGTTDIVSGQAFMIGETERGPIDEPLLLRSFSDYTTYYGNYAAGYLYPHVKSFFEEGGSRLWVKRNVDDAANAAVGALTINDANASAQPTMTVKAKTPGAWSNNLTIETTTAGSLAGQFKLIVRLSDETIFISRDLESVADAISVVASSQISHLIEIEDEDASDAIPEVTNNGTAGSGKGLLGGSVSAATNASIVAELNGTGVYDAFSVNLKSGAVLAPEHGGVADVWAALGAHAKANNRVAFCDFAANRSASEARSDASAYSGLDYASHMAFYWPHVKVAVPNVTELVSGTSTTGASTLTIAPSSYAAAARARAVAAASGPWRAGAGQISSANAILGLAADVTPATGDAMDNARVNALRRVGGQIRVYGARSVSNDEANWRYITMQDTINYISTGIEDRMDRYVFETIDARGNLFGRLRGSIKAFLEPIRVAGGLFEAYDEDGVLIDPGYNVTVNSTNNPTSQLATGLVKVDVGVRVSGVADLINITITKSNLTAPVI